jgi:hypothetical protein
MTALARDLAGDLSASLRFIDDFLYAWEARRRRVQHGVDRTGPIDDALAALLTLSTSSAMIGAQRLSVIARELHAEAQLLGTVPPVGAEQLLRIGDASCEELWHASQSWRLAS